MGVGLHTQSGNPSPGFLPHPAASLASIHASSTRKSAGTPPHLSCHVASILSFYWLDKFHWSFILWVQSSLEPFSVLFSSSGVPICLFFLFLHLALFCLLNFYTFNSKSKSMFAKLFNIPFLSVYICAIGNMFLFAAFVSSSQTTFSCFCA